MRTWKEFHQAMEEHGGVRSWKDVSNALARLDYEERTPCTQAPEEDDQS